MSWKGSLRFERDGGGLAGAEAIEGATDFRIPGGEAGGSEKGGIDLTGFASGKEGTGGFAAKLPEKSQGAGGGGRVRNEERAGPF